ncbi:hypothetical protein [Roseateles terrae]|uniref:Permease n=1 Tax=Roseateles terrae TaxID=431060 RepID=A0ABR6GVP9_9BURK|nr:hypothetical protein [Roseateles terrae]MBB3196185.1 hypothetical protein [Roseateles terrae]OWQ85357.1 hypothetical protein CDN98_15595 [Roseateles terrae]
MIAHALAPVGPARLPGYGAVLRVWLHRVRYTVPVVLFLQLAIIALVAVTASNALLPTVEFVVVVGLGILWAGYFAALQRQNHPFAARLLPGQLRMLRELAVGGFCVSVLPSAWMLSISPLQWSFPAALALSSLACAVLAVIVRWPALWVVGWVLSSLVGGAMPAPLRLAARQRVMEIYQDQPASMAAFVLVMVGALLWHLFQSGGPAHVRSWARHSKVRKVLLEKSRATEGSDASPHWAQPVIETMERAFGWLRSFWLNKLIRDARPTLRSVMARVEMASGPQAHWTSVLGAVVLISGAVALALIVAMLVSPDGHEISGIVTQSFAFSYLAMLMNPLVAVTSASLLRRRREQTLLVMLPGMPRGQAMNRQLALRQMAVHALSWSAALLLMSGLLALADRLKGGADATSIWRYLAVGYAALVLPMGVLQWRNWAVQEETPPALTLILVAGTMGAAFCLAFWMQSGVYLTPTLLLTASVLLTVLLMAMRWPRINRFPSFWPVGRNA